jgi:hypothetical protein
MRRAIGLSPQCQIILVQNTIFTAERAQRNQIFSLAVERNGKRKGTAARINQVDLQAVSFSFSLSRRKAEKSQPPRPSRLCGEPNFERGPWSLENPMKTTFVQTTRAQ